MAHFTSLKLDQDGLRYLGRKVAWYKMQLRQMKEMTSSNFLEILIIEQIEPTLFSAIIKVGGFENSKKVVVKFSKLEAVIISQICESFEDEPYANVLMQHPRNSS